ncbi:4'-phosphopantetheinyl transferase superfamily protein [Rhodobacteraceae bacterium]|nr:4'-phosphopantetheinyl transferase superfamily protein [Paracoccaceae bacterium]
MTQPMDSAIWSNVEFAGHRAAIASVESATDAGYGDVLQRRARARARLLRQLQTRFDLPLRPVHKDKNSAPVWPRGQRGSITHWRTRSVCLLYPGNDLNWGIDLEGPADGQAIAAISTEALCPQELELLGADLSRDCALVFSAKESFYKAAYPTVGHIFGFDALRLRSRPANHLMQFELAYDLSRDLTKGRAITVAYRPFAGAYLTWTALACAPDISAAS